MDLDSLPPGTTPGRPQAWGRKLSAIARTPEQIALSEFSPSLSPCAPWLALALSRVGRLDQRMLARTNVRSRRKET
jgi:hypothetical protein